MAIEKDKKVKVMYLFKEDGGYGLQEIEIQKSVLDKNGKVVDSALPDVFAVCVNNVIKKCRDIFEI